jgi:hypothetical protein
MKMTLEEINTRIDALPAIADVPMTPRAQEEDAALRSDLINRRNQINRSTKILEEYKPLVAEDEIYLEELTAVRKAIVEEAMAIPKRISEPRLQGKLMNLQISVRCLDEGMRHVDGTGWSFETLRLGALMKDRGLEWRGAHNVVRERMQNNTRRCEDAQQRLDAAMKDA